MSEIGFDEGSLFDTLSKPKHTIEKFKYNKDGSVKSKQTTTFSYWDAVMAIGGPALLFTIWHIIQRVGGLGDWYDENIRGDPVKEKLFKIGGPGLVWLWEKNQGQIEAIKDIEKMAAGPIGAGWTKQILENWGIEQKPTRKLTISDIKYYKCRDYWLGKGIAGPISAEQLKKCQEMGLK